MPGLTMTAAAAGTALLAVCLTALDRENADTHAGPVRSAQTKIYGWMAENFG